ncbi:MAG TPA: hypothetical protein VF408_03120 [Sediminibacterium sp.]
MKTLSLKLDDTIFEETEKVTSKMNMTRNRYINDAVNLYNHFNKRKLLGKKLAKESALVSGESLSVLHEFEKMMHEDQTI